MINSERIGRAIRTLRKKAGYTQKELADQLFVSPMAVSKWERGKSIPDPAILRKLSTVLDMDVDGLLDGTATYLDDRWRGALCLEDSKLPADSLMFDKPLIDYLISYFLLAGVREILISCSAREREYIDSRFRGGEALGVRLRFWDSGTLTAGDMLPREEEADLMLLSAPFFLYGVDLTRFFQRAMQHRAGAVSPASVVGQGGTKIREGYSQYEYQAAPACFLRSGFLSECGEDVPLRSLPALAEREKRLYMEPMDKGFVLSPLRGAQDVETVSQLVRIIEALGRYLIYCPLEIAWRRGMIGKEQMLREAERFPEYLEYMDLLRS